MGPHLGNASTFLISALFGIYILAVMLRFLFQWVRADFSNPISQFIYKVTNPPLMPMRRFIPSFRGLDFSAVVLMITLQTIELLIIGLLPGQPMPAFPGVIGWALAELVGLWINIYIFGILILAVISWINPTGYNPMVGLISQLTNPIMRPIRRYIKPMSGLDLSPMFALFALIFVKMAFVELLIYQFRNLSFPNASHLF